jgi:hypothetical protein
MSAAGKMTSSFLIILEFTSLDSVKLKMNHKVKYGTIIATITFVTYTNLKYWGAARKLIIAVVIQVRTATHIG